MQFCKGRPLGYEVNQGHNPNQFAKQNLGRVIIGDPIIPRIMILELRIYNEDSRGCNRGIHRDVVKLIFMNIECHTMGK